MVDRYWRKVESVKEEIENSMQISSILLKLKEYDEKVNDLSKIGTNKTDIASNFKKINTNKNDISNNLKKIGTNKTNISNNLEKINDIESDMTIKIKKDIFDKTYIIPNKTISFNGNKRFKIFSETIHINYTDKGIFYINSNYNYSYKNNINEFSHIYKVYDYNFKSFKELELYHKNNLNDSFIQEKISFKTKNTSKFLIDIFLVNNEWDIDTIDLFDYNYIRFVYYDEINSFLMNINKDNKAANENNISSNLEKTYTNKNAISSNLTKINNISSNKPYLKDVYNILFIRKIKIYFRKQ